MKTLNAKNKTKDQAKKQIKRWFARNPNRKVIEVELTTGLIQVTRENYIK
jgi:hypothetical protein